MSVPVWRDLYRRYRDQKIFPNLNTLHGQLALLMIVVAILSAFIKNIGALAIMMPVAFQFARKSSVSPSKYLMPDGVCSSTRRIDDPDWNFAQYCRVKAEAGSDRGALYHV